MTQRELTFDGPDLTPADAERLGRQLRSVLLLMLDREWRTLEQIQMALAAKHGVPATTPSISARLRDLRKKHFGGYKVGRKRVGQGLFAYRLEE